MPRLHRHGLVAAVVSIAALSVTGAPAHALSVQAPLPPPPGQLPQTPPVTVTAPGAEVTVGPGGANVNVDPGKTVGGVIGGQPPGGSSPAPTESSPSTAQGGSGDSGNGSSPGGDSSSPVRSSPAAGGRTARATRRGSSPAAGATSARPGSAGSSATPRVSGTRGVAARRPAGRADASEPGVVTRLVEKVPGELLAALLLVALFAAVMSVVWMRERGRVRAARRVAQVDALTGIPNRLAFELRLADEWKRAGRYGRPLGLLLLDIDGLKRVNDTDGHEAGDRLIRGAAERISAHIRQSDMAARLAGDEFVVLCPETDRHGLEQLGAKLTERLGSAGIAASLGWAELSERDIQPSDLLARADAAMYQDKARRRQGRLTPTARPGLAIAG